MVVTQLFKITKYQNVNFKNMTNGFLVCHATVCDKHACFTQYIPYNKGKYNECVLA